MMNKLIVLVAAVLAFLVASGCDWTSGGGVDSWNSRYNWVNFSGVYRGIDGGILVTDFTATPGTPGVTNSVVNEQVAVADGVRTTFPGTLSHRPVVSGSARLSVAGFVLSDNGDGVLSGGGKSGSIDYGTGAWAVDLGVDAPSPGEPVLASYQYTISGTGGSGGAGSGTTGVAIRSFTVFQEGETLRITDNTGAVYEGKMGSIRGSGGAQTLTVGDTIIAQYAAEGKSSAGLRVRKVGTFQGVVGADTLGNRQMMGTWIEQGGRTGDINAQAAPLPIQIPQDAGAN